MVGSWQADCSFAQSNSRAYAGRDVPRRARHHRAGPGVRGGTGTGSRVRAYRRPQHRVDDAVFPGHRGRVRRRRPGATGGPLRGPDRRERRVRRRDVLPPGRTDAVDQRATEYPDQRGSVLEARAAGTGWNVQFRSVDRDQFDTFRELPAERDHSFELPELFEPGAPRQTVGGVTPAQRDAGHGHRTGL